MATTIYDTVEIELSDKTVISVKPLSIFYLKKFMVEIDKIKDPSVTEESQVLEIFIAAGMVCMEVFHPPLSIDKDAFEKVVEVPTLMKILEVAGGLNLDNPNPLQANLAGTV